MQHKYVPLFLLFFILCFSACQPTKYMKDDQLLYNGASVTKKDKGKDRPRATLMAELGYKVRQSPNKKIFGKRFKLWVHQRYHNHTKEKGFKHWLKTKIGEPPVIYNPSQTEQSRLLMEQHLRNNGYLDAKVAVDTTIKKQIVDVSYTVQADGRYFINDYILPPDTTILLGLIRRKTKKPLIQSGKPYTLAAIDAERLRIETLARNNGFFEFQQSALYFYLDTTVVDRRKIDVYLAVKPPANRKDYKRYQLGDVTIYPDYSLNKNSSEGPKQDTIQEDHWRLIQNKEIVKLSAFKEAIAQDSGALYSQQLERQAINYLLDFGVFKFVNLKYEKELDGEQAVLHRNFYLTPALNQDVGISLEASTERTNFLGYTAGVNYIHRNLFRGAEQFKAGLSVGTETQAGGGGPFFNTIEGSFDAGLSIPRLLTPFKITKRLKGAIPKTLINVNGSYQRRNTLFTSASVLTELGYSWKQKQNFRHLFYPFQWTMLRLLNISDEFQTELNSNPRLQASFDNLLIVAASYRFSYSNQLINIRNNYWFFKGEIETAGNVASLLGKANPNDPDASKTLFNTNVAQFARTQAEVRYTWYQPKTSVVFRLASGLALPYGNSKAVPYIRQFFVGGAGSNRAFRFRGVGPGSYSPEVDPENPNIAFFDRVGDIKLEGNIEYRFPLMQYLNGAVYVDAGNVWLSKKSGKDLPEGIFEPNRFYKELAIGTGVGLRVDIQYVVIRFDFGIPIRDPALPDGERWLVKDISLGSRSWRKDNLVFNLAIGYPF